MAEDCSGAVERGVADLVAYALDRGLIGEEDVTYAANLMLDALSYEPTGAFVPKEAVAAARAAAERPELEVILAGLLDDAVERGVCDPGIASRDLLDTRLMGCVTPRPSEVVRTFWERYDESPEAATDYFYHLALDSDYIRTYRIARDRKWVTSTRYGDLDVTINLSKPEKDPRDIANALKSKAAGYPKCMLCVENPGYAGRPGFPARQNHRMIPLNLNGESWHMQYSPYLYYNEHCIVLSDIHRPMAISEAGFRRLFAFVGQFPHYFLGSNADLPIVGGSILTHDHFQGGNYEFPMDRAGDEIALTADDPAIRASIVDWPMSCLRLKSTDAETLVRKAVQVLNAWRGYSDEAMGVYAETDQKHNTITPILRRAGGEWKLDLVLRNNITTPEHPLGVYHPHAELHHIKKENIGLIEVMGLAVLPARLKNEMALLEKAMLENRDIRKDEVLAKHADWADEVRRKYGELTEDNISEIIRDEIGLVFSHVLEHAGVCKRTEEGRDAFLKFAAGVNKCS